jgi:hypothetical protein
MQTQQCLQVFHLLGLHLVVPVHVPFAYHCNSIDYELAQSHALHDKSDIALARQSFLDQSLFDQYVHKYCIERMPPLDRV